MKFLIILPLLNLFTVFNLLAQTAVPENHVTKIVFDAITFNGVTIEQIEQTQGELSAVSSLLGTPTSTNIHTDFMQIVYYYNNNYFSYTTAYNTMDGVTLGSIGNLEIQDTSWAMNIQGVDIRVGMHFNEVEELLVGNNILSELKLAQSNLQSRGLEKFVSINYADSEHAFVHINFNPITMKISSILYWTLT
jgi:hypothetical protein